MIYKESSHWLPVSLEECIAMTPADMASKSAVVQNAYRYLVQTAGNIAEYGLRQRLTQVLENPVPSFLQMYNDTERTRLWQMLLHNKAIAENVTQAEMFPSGSDNEQAPQPFWTAPGSSYDRHHSYPGGLAVHTAMNVRASLELRKVYQETYGCRLNRDTIVAGQVLHDSQKPWILQWTADGGCCKQIAIAGEGAHHVLGLAESIHRGFAPAVVLAQACTHNHPATRENAREILNWIRIACLLVNKDPEVFEQEMELDAEEFLPRLEWFVTYQGDHNWVLSVKAAKTVIKAVKQVAADVYKLEANGSKFHSFRNYLFSQQTILKLYEMLVEQGFDRFKYFVCSMIYQGY